MSTSSAGIPYQIGEAKPLIWPFYIVCDSSNSMWRETESLGKLTPFRTIQDSLPQLINDLQDDEQARDIAWLSIVSFSQDVQEVLPLTKVRRIVSISSLTQGTLTDYRKVFKHLHTELRKDTAKLSQQGRLCTPTIFFLTDGYAQDRSGQQPVEQWLPELNRLKQGSGDRPPSIICLGFGAAVENSILLISTTTPPGAACIAEPGVPANELMSVILESIVFSLTHSTAQGELIFETPRGMRRLDG